MMGDRLCASADCPIVTYKSGATLDFPLKEIAVCRTAYQESDRKDLDFGLVPRIAGVSFQTKFAAACRPQRLISFAQICKLFQNIMTQLEADRGGRQRDGARLASARRARSRCRGPEPCYFPPAAGPPAVSVKGSYSSFIEDEDG